MSHTTTILLPGYFSVNLIRAFTMFSVSPRSRRMRSTLPSDSWRKPMYFCDFLSRSTRNLTLVFFAYQEGYSGGGLEGI